MNEIFRGSFLSLYAQIALFDAEDPDSYPQWETGEERIVFGKKGVAVATAGDVNVEVVVYNGKGGFTEEPTISQQIHIGNKGVFVGNVPSSDINKVALASGNHTISVYTDRESDAVTKVVFCID